ncbi:hypothetical protein EDC01DRAFT_704783 [Geopyxis carbonaria]|nr:hypothetical protein EDC01DRAFT_704783 [Geopyxis carbonaria]
MAPTKIISDTALPESIPESGQTPATAPTSTLFSLTGRTILITGGGRGLGLTLARAVLEAGGDVACVDVLSEPTPAEWKALQLLAKSTGLNASYHLCDITDEEAVIQCFDAVVAEAKQHGKVFKGVIACAGIQQQVDAIKYPVEGFRRIMEVNVTGTFLTSKHAARVFVEEKIAGSLVMIASMSGEVANRGLHCSAYNSSKAAVQQLCRSVAQEWGQYGIRVNTLSPGYIRTAMTDQLLQEKPEVEKTWMAGALLGRLGAPEDFKGPAVFLLSDASVFMTGSDLRVDGGHCASA